MHFVVLYKEFGETDDISHLVFLFRFYLSC